MIPESLRGRGWLTLGAEGGGRVALVFEAYYPYRNPPMPRKMEARKVLVSHFSFGSIAAWSEVGSEKRWMSRIGIRG